MAKPARIVVYRSELNGPWLIQLEDDVFDRTGCRQVSEVHPVNDRFGVVHALAIARADALGIPVYVPKYAYDPTEDEPGWDLPQGADRATVDAYLDRKLARKAR